MSQPKLDIVSIAVSVKIADEVALSGSPATSGTDGDIFTGTDRLSAINRACGWVYTEILNKLGEKEFINLYPEFLAYASKSTTTKAADIRKVINIYVSAGSPIKVVKAIPGERVYDAQYNTQSPFYATADNPGFIETASAITVLGLTATGDQPMLYIQQPTDIAGYGGANTDLIVPYIWLEHIIEKATEILLLNLNNL